MTTIEYRDPTILWIVRAAWVLVLAGVAALAGLIAGLVDAPVDAYWWVTTATAFFLVVAIAYHRAVAVRLEIGPKGITKRQALGMGWQVDWAAVAELALVSVMPRMLAVMSLSLPARRGPTEWPIRFADVPVNTHAIPASVEVMEAVTRYYDRPIQTLEGRFRKD